MSLKQSAKDLRFQRETARDGDYISWQRGGDCACLRVDISTQEAFVFPYQQFSAAHLVSTAGVDSVKITFVSHEITVTGYRLEKLVSVLQDFAIDRLAMIPGRYRNVGESNEPLIAAISVRVLSEEAEVAPKRER